MAGIRLFVALTLVSLGCAERPTPIAEAGAPADRLDNLLRDAVRAGEVASAVGLVARDGQVVFQGAFGEAAPGESIRSEAIVRLASSAKTMTAAVALALVEGGELALDDPISAYIPEFGTVTLADGVPSSGRPTVRHLLTHTAGLDVTSERFESLWDLAMAEDPITSLDFARQLSRLPLQVDPGEAFDYGFYGSSYEVLAAVLEVAAGVGLEELTTTLIFEPLGMGDSYFWVPETKRPRIAARYTRGADGQLTVASPAGFETERGAFVSGGGQVRTTIGDFHRFLSALLNGGDLDGRRILEPESVRQMMSPHVSAEIYGHSSGDFGWGFGGRVRLRQGDAPGAPGTYDWHGGTGTSYWIDPAARMVGILFTPVRPPAEWDVHARFRVAAYEAVED